MENRYDVFISYSTQDQKVVEGICGFLEREGYRCFVAYRDIPQGVVWATAITDAIDASAIMLVVFSQAFNLSPQTDREIELASENRIPILTYRVSNTPMTGAKKYYLKNLNWIDAFPNPEKHFGRLLDSVARLIGPSKTALDNAAKEETERLAKLEAERKAREAKERERQAEEARRMAEQERRERERAEAQRKAEQEEVTRLTDSSDNDKPYPKKGFWMGLGAAAVVALVMLLAWPKKDPPAQTYYQIETPPAETTMFDLTITANGVSFTMKPVEGGTFQMGSNDSEAYDDEKPVHSVTISTFYMGETEVTQALWKAVMGTTVSQQRDKADKTWPLRGEGDNYPMYYVSWNECQKFVAKLNNLTGRNFRLPTEAEWEYAARGGNNSNGYKYAGSNTIGDVAWYTETTKDEGTCQVKTKRPNELGLYDMSGNVWEWCSDWYGSYGSDSQTNPKGASSGSCRVLRGGSWVNSAGSCRVSLRYRYAPDRRYNDRGFRLCLPQ